MSSPLDLPSPVGSSNDDIEMPPAIASSEDGNSQVLRREIFDALSNSGFRNFIKLLFRICNDEKHVFQASNIFNGLIDLLKKIKIQEGCPNELIQCAWVDAFLKQKPNTAHYSAHYSQHDSMQSLECTEMHATMSLMLPSIFIVFLRKTQSWRYSAHISAFRMLFVHGLPAICTPFARYSAHDNVQSLECTGMRIFQLLECCFFMFASFCAL